MKVSLRYRIISTLITMLLIIIGGMGCDNQPSNNNNQTPTVSSSVNPTPAAVATCSGVADEKYATAITQATNIVMQLKDKLGEPGVSMAVAVDGKIVWSAGFGYADVEQKLPLCPQTLLRMASVSKPLTAGAMAQLYEQGKFDLDAPIQQYVPSFPDKGEPITLRQLSGHLAGIREYKFGDDLRHYDDATSSLAIFQKDPLLFPPGAGYSYSNYGFQIIGAAIEHVSGEKYTDYMTQHIFKPLGMEHTILDRKDVPVPQRSRFYASSFFSVYEVGYEDLSGIMAAGGWLSTAEDLARYGSAYLDSSFLKHDTVEMMFTSQKVKSGEQTGYGMGWVAADPEQQHRLVWHNGGLTGTRSYLAVLPDDKVVVAMLANISYDPYDVIPPVGAQDIGEAFAAVRAGQPLPTVGPLVTKVDVSTIEPSPTP